MKYLLLTCALILSAFSESRTINNELKLQWPNELVYMDFPAGKMKGKTAVELKSVMFEKGEYQHEKWLNPIQVETLTINGKKVDRVWYKATLKGQSKKDSKGRIKHSPAPIKAVVEFNSKKAPSGIIMKEDNNYYIINNGVYEFRLRKYKKIATALRLDKVKHFIAGMRPIGSNIWEGKAFFQGTAKVHSIKTEFIQKGPVFIDVKITFDFSSKAIGQTDSIKLLPGKQSHTYKPNRIPRITLPKKEKHYEVIIRFVANDPWIDISERAKLPKDPNVKGWEIHQYYLLFGKTKFRDLIGNRFSFCLSPFIIKVYHIH